MGRKTKLQKVYHNSPCIKRGFHRKMKYKSKKQYKNPELYKSPELQHCYEMGIDSVISGMNKVNSDINLFSTPEKTKAWEFGKISAKHRKRYLYGID